MAAAAFLGNLIAAAPYRLHIVLTPSRRLQASSYRATNRTIKEATVNRFHDDDHEQLRNFISACNFRRRS